MDSDVHVFRDRHVPRALCVKFYVNSNEIETQIRFDFSFISAESTLTGDNHNGNSSDRQPRLGNANCDTCVDGTLADSNGQRHDD